MQCGPDKVKLHIKQCVGGNGICSKNEENTAQIHLNISVNKQNEKRFFEKKKVH